jgi:hypothetical protein
VQSQHAPSQKKSQHDAHTPAPQTLPVVGQLRIVKYSLWHIIIPQAETSNQLQMTTMLPRQQYKGSERKLVLAFDVGTTLSGVSYCILDTGEVPIIRGVSRSVTSMSLQVAHSVVVADILPKSKSAVTPKYHRLSTMIFREKSAQWVPRLFENRSSNRQKTMVG